MSVSNQLSVLELLGIIGQKHAVFGAKMVYLGRFLQDEKTLSKQMVDDRAEIYLMYQERK